MNHAIAKSFLFVAWLMGSFSVHAQDGLIELDQTVVQVPVKEMTAYQRAAAYSRAHRGLSMVVIKEAQIVFEDYAKGHSASEAHKIMSGTKSFSCAIAVAAIQDGLLSFDEPVSQTITEWQTDPQKSKITVRQLLTLTSGIDAGKPRGAIPTYGDALRARMLHPPGTAFQYGPVPFQVFGELMRRKLAAGREGPREYLVRRVLQPIGLKVDSWLTTADGNPRMSGGAFLTAREWAKYGQLILNGGRWANKEILNDDLLSECFRGTTVNPGYGITFWLPVNGGINPKGRSMDKSAAKLKEIQAPSLIIEAWGLGEQKLYVIPSRNLVIVRQATRLPLWATRLPLWGRGFEDAGFLAPILSSGRGER
jgi:CubicO group peptidase (beta-lactamase class C family)